ncbi:MAG: hypothetical protein HDT43_02300 [Ruminococcaceae bacterium]|nr:hypothetical protein [Oscillospiraceae bacterium]
MEDTKKLIEKYKRELMELSRRSANPAPGGTSVPVVDDEPKETAERKPQVIGYVSEESGEFPAVYDRFLAEIIDKDESAHPEDIVEDEEEGCAEPEAPEAPEKAPEAPADDDIVDTSDVRFTPPKYAEIPSTEQVREDITEQSDGTDNYPEENVSGITDNSATAPRPDLADVQSVSEEKAETLADQPISGTKEGEQLTGRSFEDESFPQNPENPSDSIMRQGSGAEPTKYPEPVYDDYDDFVKRNIGRGTMLFRVYTAQEALPIMGARCVISKKIGGEMRELCSLITDSSGQTRAETLPAPSKELSQSYENSVQPFALYDATVTKKDYADVILRDIPVFDGVQSIQRVAMVPAVSETTEEITEVENAR